MQNEIIILCNSAACLNEISAGHWPNLHQKNIFTCNFAYTHFRTSGLHFNIFSDADPIIAFLTCENWDNVFTSYPYKNTQFVLNTWDIDTKKINPIPSNQFNLPLIKSPIKVPASSSIGALLYLNACENFEKIHLVGYTINEWEGIETVKELKSKQEALNDLHKNYQQTNPREFVYIYERRG
jgi:hypothetical protein